jgi:hypothetical protein
MAFDAVDSVVETPRNTVAWVGCAYARPTPFTAMMCDCDVFLFGFII